VTTMICGKKTMRRPLIPPKSEGESGRGDVPLGWKDKEDE